MPTDRSGLRGTGPLDVMGYHTESDIPNYWTYARDYVLQDHMFEPNASWSLPAHLFQVSEWSADCTQHDNPSSRAGTTTSSSKHEVRPRPAVPARRRLKRPAGSPGTPIYAWTDLTYLLHKQHVSWGYYVVSGTEPDCEDDAARDRARRCKQDVEDARDLEPAAVLRHRPRPTTSSATSRASASSTKRRRPARCPRCRGSSPRARSASTRRQR